MKGKAHILWKKITFVLLIVVMGCLLINQALYTHTHVKPDGSIVSHAHPFNKTQESKQGKSHTHSSLEFFLLQNLNLLFLAALISLVLNNLGREFLKVQTSAQGYITALLISSPGRAPPLV